MVTPGWGMRCHSFGAGLRVCHLRLCEHLHRVAGTDPDASTYDSQRIYLAEEFPFLANKLSPYYYR
jgi:hypothetical protein